ncbi:hypothetical protein HY041_02300, partial [Candidatus Roizmanbacteria bacterium]|nr:hypothetical protein [Candidatus Roizmanbacteria bacterium]
GYPFAKILAILFISYTTFVSGIVKILPFTQSSLLIIIGIFLLINAVVFLKRKKDKSIPYHQSSIILLIFEELLFLFSLLLWTYIRGQEPSIRSLEKFMDFGFINSILRSRYFPPLDMWYSGGFPINYYYFGHLTGATLIKLANIKSSIGYNLILSTIFALSITGVFSLVIGFTHSFIKKLGLVKIIFFGIIGSIIVNLGGNLHTIYLFTTGYPNDNPIPFWQILSGFNPAKYWYPNATRFIPLTIHEFPSYSYVVADLHGHVFDIPFVLLTIAILFILFTQNQKEKALFPKLPPTSYSLLPTIFLGFLTAIHYMTNAFDGPIYLLLSILMTFILFRFTLRWIFNSMLLFSSFITFSLPFSKHFTPFVTGIGVNCSPKFLTDIGRIGPFLFEKGNCQASPFWMLFVLWGFFWICFVLFIAIKYINKQSNPSTSLRVNNRTIEQSDKFIFLLFAFGTFLVIIPEFFYIKDIYPAHFRANTMFKLGYQAFIIMGIASIYTFSRIKTLKKSIFTLFLTGVFIFFFSFIGVYPFFSVPSYYGALHQPVEPDGSVWLSTTYPEDKAIINYLNRYEKGQPVILEAQGDSYTDFGRISAFTGLPTVAGWLVHEWLWRGSSDVIARRIPNVITLYESPDVQKTRQLIEKYRIKYVIISKMERQKYTNLNEHKFGNIGRLIFRTNNGFGALYQVN